MKLISMTYFVLEQVKKMESKELAYLKIFNYAKFLKQLLTLGMFVPCDLDGNVLEEPKNYDKWLAKEINTPYDLDLILYEQYTEAKERVLFKNFEYKNNQILYKGIFYFNIKNYNDIDELIKYGQELELTQSAIKQLGL